MNGALETLISQAIGASNAGGEGKTHTKNLAVIYLNRGRILILLAFMPVILLLLNVDKLLNGLGQDSVTTKYARDYIVA
jgi:Na+-driven multidrug efflux pump